MAVRLCVCVVCLFWGRVGVVQSRTFVCVCVCFGDEWALCTRALLCMCVWLCARARVCECACVFVCVSHELQLQDLYLWNVWSRELVHSAFWC